MQILTGDIGGTKTLLQRIAFQDGQWIEGPKQRYDSHAYPDLAPMVQAFLRDHPGPSPDTACFAVAGPVHDGMARLTYLPWELEQNRLQAQLNIPRVRIINDFEAIGYGISTLLDSEYETLQTGQAVPGAIQVVLGAGTGLGQCIRIRKDEQYQVLATEGGHADFAPVNTEQIALLQHLLTQHERVSYDDLVSGKGLVRIYDFLCQDNPNKENPQLRDQRIHQDAAATISEFALQHNDPLANHALDMFVSIYGAQAGNLALTALALGGVYIAGGIAPKILPKFHTGLFMQYFLAKSPMQHIIRNIPVHVILNPEIGLRGAGAYLLAEHQLLPS